MRIEGSSSSQTPDESASSAAKLVLSLTTNILDQLQAGKSIQDIMKGDDPMNHNGSTLYNLFENVDAMRDDKSLPAQTHQFLSGADNYLSSLIGGQESHTDGSIVTIVYGLRDMSSAINPGMGFGDPIPVHRVQDAVSKLEGLNTKMDFDIVLSTLESVGNDVYGYNAPGALGISQMVGHLASTSPKSVADLVKTVQESLLPVLKGMSQ